MPEREEGILAILENGMLCGKSLFEISSDLSNHVHSLLAASKQEDREFVAQRLTEWIRSEPRKPANQAFTEGPLRQIAYAVEESIQSTRRDALAGIESALCDVAQVFDGWAADDPKNWTEHDRSVRKRLADLQVEVYAARSISPAPPPKTCCREAVVEAFEIWCEWKGSVLEDQITPSEKKHFFEILDAALAGRAGQGEGVNKSDGLTHKQVKASPSEDQ